MSDTLTGLQKHLRDVHKNEAASNLTMTQALSYHAQEHLGAGGIRNHSEPRQLHRALAYRLAALQGLEVPKDDIVNFLDQVLEGKIRGDHEDERESIEAVLNRHPEGGATRAWPSGGQHLAAFKEWKKTLSETDSWGHCGDVTQHDEHRHTVVTNEGRSPGTCVGTPDLTVMEAEHARAQRPGSQPLPAPRAGVAGAHDMVLSDLRGIMTRRQVALRNAGKTVEADTVRKLLKEIEADLIARRALGLQRYGALLQPGNGRDPMRDAYEEVVDLVAYFKQLIMARDEAVTLLTELLQDHAVGEDPVVREKIGQVMYLLAGEIKKGSNDGGVEA